MKDKLIIGFCVINLLAMLYWFADTVGESCAAEPSCKCTYEYTEPNCAEISQWAW